MDPAMTPADRIEGLARERRHILLVSVITYAVWCGGLILSLSQPFARGGHLALSIVTLVFGALWGGSLVWLLLWARRVKAYPEVMTALNDEMIVRNRWRAQRASLSALLVCLVAGVEMATFMDFSARTALLSMVWVLVVSQIGFYLWYDRSE